MSAVLLILKIILAVACAAGVSFLVVSAVEFWIIAESIYSGIGDVIKKIENPIKRLCGFLYNKIKAALGERKEKIKAAKNRITSVLDSDPFSRLANRFPVLGTGKSLRFAAVTLLAFALFIAITLATKHTLTLSTDVLAMFPFFFVISLINGESAFTLVGVVSTGISALLISKFFNFFMGEYKRGRSLARWLISVGYYIVTTVAGCFLGYFLSGLWELIAAAGIAAFDTVRSSLSASGEGALGIAATVLCAVALLIIAYFGALLVITAVREYIETVCYGGIGVLLFVVALFLSAVFGGNAFINSGIGGACLGAAFVISVLAFDFARVSKGEIIENYKKRKAEKEEKRKAQ